MKHSFSYLALLATLLTAAFAGCQREPVPGTDDIIRFSVASAVISAEETKVADPNKPHESDYLLQDARPIKLFGCCTETGSATRTLLFNDVSLACTDLTTEKWEYSPLRYWVQSGAHDFRAVFPAPAAGDFSYDKDYDKLDVKFTMGVKDELLVASAQQAAASRKSDKVPLNFQHACAAVRFMFKDANGDTAPNYSISCFELQNLFKTGTLSYNEASGTAIALSKWSYTDTADASAYLWTASDSDPVKTVSTADFTALYGWFFVVPQEIDDAKIYFKYKIGTESLEYPATLSLDLTDGVADKWEPGSVYTYKITIQSDYIGLSVGIDDWIDGGDWSLTE